MKKIQIAFLSANAYPLFNPDAPPAFGGAEVDQYNLAVYLAQQPDFSVIFYVGDFGQPDEPEFRDGVRLEKIRYFGWHQKTPKQKLVFYSRLWRTLWRSPAQVMLTEMANDMVGWAALFFKVFRNKYMIHRLASDNDTAFTSPSAAGGRRTYHLYRLGLYRADEVLTQTVQQQRLLKERMQVESRVVPNGFPAGEAINFQEKKDILWVGRCIALKRPRLFLQLAQQLPHLSFKMIMPPPSPMEPPAFLAQAAEMTSLAKSLPNLTFLPSVPFREIQAHYNSARALVNTSEYEGFPNSFVQACLGGAPIASLKVDPDGVITRHGLGICCHDDMQQMEDFLRRLDDDTLRQLGTGALKYGREHHQIEVMGEPYASMIRQRFA
ncbi:glycosyltransferase family 4 protein [Anoxynatronum buryatiense]|uniref:Glycosyltransferase involved in cell wall bisynthesis n=1 Tax=Anoxynatronum buryatiense TaxID=489973 RepID=A0AA46AIV4_9CLOT|nr:glycosyltransferase family 4 protein [Anoxynatronum buryatiense]SMP54853.1 Glycosyltransferase involved in cell wall bisynthesis [Anoxynatronum buryatiense]